MDHLKNLPLPLNNDKQMDINIQPRMIHLSHTTPPLSPSISQYHQPSILSTTKSSMLVPSPLSRIVTYRIPTSESSISFSVPIMSTLRIDLATSKETDEPSQELQYRVEMTRTYFSLNDSI